MKTTKNKTHILIAILIGILLDAIFSIWFKWRQTGKLWEPETILVFFIVLVAGYAMLYIAWRMMNYYANKPPQQLAKQIIPAMLLFYFAWYIVSNSIISIGDFIWYLIKGYDLHGFFEYLFKIEKVFINPELPQFLLVFTIIFFYILWRKSLLREQKLKEEKLVFQYETLKSQVNPHFLFNSLNTISSLVNTQPEIAELYINKLASIYRYILENVKNDKISLHSEIKFINDYFSLQKIRDGEKIQLDIQLTSKLECEILPISLQILIENAIKHNIATLEKPLKILLYYENGYIIVKNNLQKMAVLSNSSGNGLKNLEERLLLMTNKAMIINETINEFIVKLPILEANEPANR